MRVLMWEAKGNADAILAWLRTEVIPTLPQDEVSAELFRSADRVVVILRYLTTESAEERLRLPDPPAHLVARPPHAWPFDSVEG